MPTRTLALGLCFMYAVMWMPLRAEAQFAATPFSDPATGERYHIEAAGALWNPPPDFRCEESLGVVVRRSTRSPPGVQRRHLAARC